MCRNGTRSNKPLTNCRILVAEGVDRSHPAGDGVDYASLTCTIASPPRPHAYLTTAASADNNVQAGRQAGIELMNHF